MNADGQSIHTVPTNHSISVARNSGDWIWSSFSGLFKAFVILALWKWLKLIADYLMKAILLSIIFKLMFVHFGMFFKTVLSLTSCYPQSEDSTAKSMLYTVYEIEKHLA